MKAMTIEGSKYVNNIKVDKLIGSLITFEMSITDISEKKNKSVTFKADVKERESRKRY